MNKTALYLIYFCIYSAALLLIGKSSLREDPTARSYFLCDRTASLLLLCKQVANNFHTTCEKEMAFKRVLIILLNAISFTQIPV